MPCSFTYWTWPLALLILSCGKSREKYRPSFRTSKIGGSCICSVSLSRSRRTPRAATTAFGRTICTQCSVREASDDSVELCCRREDDHRPRSCWMPYGLRERLIVCGQQDASGRELNNEVEPIFLLDGRCEPDDLIRYSFRRHSPPRCRHVVHAQHFAQLRHERNANDVMQVVGPIGRSGDDSLLAPASPGRSLHAAERECSRLGHP